MRKQDKIQSELSTPLAFLDGALDSALLGYVENAGGEVLPCYGYQALKAVLKAQDPKPESLYRKMEKVYREMEEKRPMLLIRMSPDLLWSLIEKEGYPHWEQLGRAILGLGTAAYDKKGLVYSKPLCAQTLAGNSSADTDVKALEAALSKLETSIYPIHLGEHTPYYLTPVR